MAITEALRLVIDADARGAVHGIEQVGRTADRELGRSQQNLDRWGSRLTSVGAGLVSFGAVAAYGLHSAAQAASDLGETVSKSNTIFGNAAGKVEDFAESAEKIGLSKRAALDAASGFGNLFTQVGLATDSAADMSIELTSLASDFASFHNADITEVIEAQTAAFRGEYDSLQRFVPTINAAAVQQRAMADSGKETAAALTDAEKATATYALMIEGAGAALDDFDRTGDSAANRQRVLAANFENLKASIGEGALPVLEQIVGVASGGIDVFEGLNDATGGFLGKAATIATVMSLGIGGLSLLAGQAIRARENLGALADGVRSLTGHVGGLKTAAGLAAGAAGIAGLAIAAIQLGDVLGEAISPIDTSDLNKLERDLLSLGQGGRVGAELLSLAGDDLDGLADAFRRVADPAVANRARDAMTSVLSLGGDNQDLKQAREDIDAVDKALTQLASRDPEAAAATFEALTDALSEQGVSASTVRDLLDDYDSAVAGIDTAEAVADSGELEGAMSGQAGATEEATSALQEYAETLQAQFDPLFGMISAQQGLRDAQVGVTEAQTALNEALAGGDATAIAEAQRAYDDALFGSTQALVEAQSAQATLNDAVARGDVSLTDAQDALYRWAINAGYTGEQAMIMAGQLGTATSAAQILDAQNPTVDISANDRASASISLVKDRLTDLDGRYATVTVNQVWRSIGEAFGFGGGRAHGGPVSAGRLYEVAEQGRAELLEMGGRTYLIPGSDGTVVPAGASAGAGGGGGGSYVDNRTINIQTGSDPQAVVEAIKRYERGNGPGWRN